MYLYAAPNGFNATLIIFGTAVSFSRYGVTIPYASPKIAVADTFFVITATSIERVANKRMDIHTPNNMIDTWPMSGACGMIKGIANRYVNVNKPAGMIMTQMVFTRRTVTRSTG